MSRKFSIIKTIDLNKLCHEIDEYIMQTKELKPYIFMHIDTIDAIDEASSTSFTNPSTPHYEGVIGYWEGYKIFVNNDLKFGEVEIR